MLRRLTGPLRAVDSLVILMLALLTGVSIALHGFSRGSLALLGTNAAISAGIVWLARAARLGMGGRALRIAHGFHAVPMIFVVFKEVHVVIQSMERADFDPIFIAIDRWIFGGDPTVWMARFASPLLTEILQISYASYYFIMIALGIELYRRGPGGPFPFVVFTITLGFFLSYVGYMLFPGVGPRFTLHQFAALDHELPGLLLTEVLRDAINAGESIPPGAPNPMELAQRDIFPSGHTQMTLLTVWYAWRHRIRSRHVVTAFGALLVVSTVYLRYHYVIDLAGGAVFMAATLLAAGPLHRLLEPDRREGAPLPSPER